MSRALVVVLALAVVLGGVLWFASGTRERRGTPAPVDGTSTSHADGTTTPEAPATIAMPPGNAAENAPAREVSPSSHEEELAHARWVDGRVVFPAGTPGDEELSVVADGRDFEDKSDHRARVERDGTFRVAFSEKTTAGSLRLEGRYLFLRQPARWKRETPQPVVLEPALGGRVEVRVVPAPGTDAKPDGKVGLYLKSDDASVSCDEFASKPITSGLTVAFDALDPESEFGLAYDGSACIGRCVPVTVSAGATRTLELALRPGVVLSGVVLDEVRRPIADADVLAVPQSQSDFAGPEQDRSVHTNADGAFTIGALGPGRINLQVERDGFVPGLLQLDALGEGERRSGLELVLLRGGAISGVVSWPDGSPAQASIELNPYESPGRWDASLQEKRGESDASGRFRITGLGASAYRLRAEASKEEETTVKNPRTGRDRKRQHSTRFSAEAERVEPGTEGIALTLSAGLTLSGRVVDDLGAPLSAATVSALRIERETFGAFDWVQGNVRDANGTFVLEGLTAGEWKVSASAEEHASAAVEVTVPATEPIEVRVPREALAAGVVLDAMGVPCARAQVRAEDSDDVRLRKDGGRTDAAGIFRLGGLGAGSTTLVATGPTGASSAPLDVELVPGQVLEGLVLRLRTGATITGEVVGLDGRPRTNVAVQVNCEEGDRDESASTDAAGRFEFRGLPPGRTELYVEGDGLTLRRSLVLADGATEHVRLGPPEGTLVRVHGHVRAGGEALARASIDANRQGEDDASGSTSSSTMSRADGSYELRLPGAARYELEFDADGPSSFHYQVTVDVPAIPDFAFDVEVPLGRVSGRVTDAAGKPLAGISIEAEPTRREPESLGYANTQTGEDGRYELAVPAGNVDVSASSDDGSDSAKYVPAHVRDVAVSPNGRLRGVDFVLGVGGSLTGVVRNADGSRVRDAWLWTDGAHESDYLVDCEDDGTFQVDGLAPGTHWIGAVSRTGATRGPVEVAIEVGKTARLELVLEPARYVHVYVRAANGTQVACEIEVVDYRGRAQICRWGNEPGEAWVGPLTPGRYTVRARRDEKRVERALEISGRGETLELELAFE